MIPGIGGRLLTRAYLERHVMPSLPAGGDAGVVPEAAAFGRWWRRVECTLGPSASARQVADVAVAPLLDRLAFGSLALEPRAWGLAGVAGASAGAPATVIVVPWAVSLDAGWREALPSIVQTPARWALVANGRELGIADCTRPWERRWLVFAFDALMRDPRGPHALRTLVRPETLCPASADSPASLDAHVDGSERLARAVCRSLGDSVIEVLPSVTQALAAGRRGARHLGDLFDQALIVVYRMLFLLFAEARGLVPIWHEVYREAYSIDALRRQATGRGPAAGLWEAFQAISRMAHAGCRAGTLDVTPFNGRLFSPAHAPLVEKQRLSDTLVRRTIAALSTAATPHGRQAIAYDDLGVEQLGSVYERVLEHAPRLGPSSIELRPAPSARKSTGSFYTPRSLTEFLVRRTLHDLVAGRTADEILRLRVVDPAMGSGAFLVAACRFLADRCEEALVREGAWQAAEVTPADRAGLRRQVAERCLFGVDLNPIAVQLARLSLWLTTLASDRPLTFLDHHLAVGNSLVGARLADLAAAPAEASSARGRDPRAPLLPIFDEAVAGELASRVLPERIRLAIEPSDTLDAVRRKERTLASMQAAGGALAGVARAADVWCAAALAAGPGLPRGLVAELMAASLGAATTLPPRELARSLDRARGLARDHQAFHWELAFPEVYFGERGHPAPDAGFDAVIGNPPWDVVRTDEGGEGRARVAALVRFCRRSGRFAGRGGGHPNRYQLFLDQALRLVRHGGRIGLVLPSGLATDVGSARLRRALFDSCHIDTWLGFDNRLAIFPIHRGVRFVLLAATRGGRTERLRYRCGLHDPSRLGRAPSGAGDDTVDPEAVSVSRTLIEAWDPDHLTVPVLTSPAALDVAARAAVAAAPLGSPAGWGVRFGRELNATDDRPHFVDRAGRGVLPLLEGKHLSPFRVNAGAARLGVRREVAARLVDAAATFDRPRLACREVAGAANRLTVIAARLPSGTISTHTVCCLKTPLADEDEWCLLALLNSLVVNYLARLRVTTHVSASLLARLPVPRPREGASERGELAGLARALADSGIDEAPRAYAALNAIVAALYGLSRDQYRHVVQSFPLLPERLRRRCVDALDGAAGSTRPPAGAPAPTPTA